MCSLKRSLDTVFLVLGPTSESNDRRPIGDVGTWNRLLKPVVMGPTVWGKAGNGCDVVGVPVHMKYQHPWHRLIRGPVSRNVS